MAVSFSSLSGFPFVILLNCLLLIAALDFIDDLQGNYPVRSILFESPKDNSAVQGDFNSIFGVAISPITGQLYFADNEKNQIFKFVENGEVELVAGTGAEGFADGDSLKAKFDSPAGLAFHPNGGLLAVADSSNHIIRVINVSDGKVSTLAGKPGVPGSLDGIGLNATSNFPSGLTFDSMGNILVVDSGNHLIRKIEFSSGRVSTIAGNGNEGYNSNVEEGPARSVSLYSPTDICFDPSDSSFYFTEFYNHAIRRVDAAGYLTTVIRNKTLYPAGIVKLENSLFVANGNYISRIDIKSHGYRVWAGSPDGVSGFFDGSLESAQFKEATFLAIDPFNSSFLLVSDGGRIRAISFRTKYVSTMLGTLGAGTNDGVGPLVRFNQPSYLSVDENNQILYVSDTENGAIRRIFIKMNHKVETVVGFSGSGYLDGSFSVARLKSPKGILVDPDDSSKIYFCDWGNSVRLLDMKTKSVSTFAHGIGFPVSVAKNENDLFFVIDDTNLYVINGTGTVDLILDANYNCGVVNPISDTFKAAYDIISDLDGSIYLSSYACNVIMKMVKSSKGAAFEIIGGDGKVGFKDGFGSSAQFYWPQGLEMSQGILLIAEVGNHVIRQLNLSDSSKVETISGTGESGYRNGYAKKAQYSYPSSVKLFNDSIYIADSTIHVIRMLKDGIVSTIAGPGAPVYSKESLSVRSIISPKAIACLDSQFCIVIDSLGNAVLKMVFDGNGQFMEFGAFAGNGSPGWMDGIGVNAMFNNPTAIAIDTNRNRLLIADTNNHLIRSINISSGAVSTIAGTGYAGNFIKSSPLECSMNMPMGMAVDPSSNVIFISDSGNHRILALYSSNNTIAVYSAGSGSPGFQNGKMQSAKFHFPTSLAFDAITGMLLILDSYNHAIRSIGRDGVVKTVSGGVSGYADGAASKARFYKPISLSMYRMVGNLNLLVVDSGNHAVRVISIDESGNATVYTWLKDEKSYYKAVAVGDYGSPVLVLDRKSVLSYSRLGFSLTSTFINESQSSQFQMIIVSASIGSIAILSVIVVFAYFRSERKKRDGQQTTRILTRIGEKEMNPKVGDRSQSVTVSPSKTVAIAIPGFLQVDLDKTIVFPSGIQVSGKGGTAQVTKCKLKDPNMIQKHGIVDAVVKIFGKETTKESFLYEVMIMSALPKSPNLIELMGYSQGRKFAIIMKDYPMSLRDLLVEKTFPNDSETNLKAAVDIANGMNLIHQKGIVHFDLKPANVLAEVVNGTWNYVICDFGFANFLSDVQDKIVKGVKKPTVIGITARYAAPELFAKVNMGNSAVNPSSIAPVDIEKKIDVYAYAMTLLYVYAREAPWKDLSLDEIEMIVIAGMRPDATIAQVGDRKIENLIKSCWSQDPHDRPSFDEIMAILSAF